MTKEASKWSGDSLQVVHLSPDASDSETLASLRANLFRIYGNVQCAHGEIGAREGGGRGEKIARRMRGNEHYVLACCQL